MFDAISLKDEINNHFITEDGKLPKQELLLKELSYLDCLKLSNKDYRTKTFKLLSYADKGIFQLSQYGTVFHFITRFDNMLKLNLKNLKVRFKKGISLEKAGRLLPLGRSVQKVPESCSDINN